MRCTGVGSMPHTDVDAAIDLIARTCPLVPFWPQLPNRDPREGMIAQVSGPWERGSALEAPLTIDEAAGLHALRASMDRFPDAELVKGQLVGPVTLAANLRREVPADELVARLIAVARGMLFELPTLIVVDEPMLGMTDKRTGLAELLRAIEDMGAIAGLHCCGAWPDDWRSLAPGAVSWDAAVEPGPGDVGEVLAMPGLVATATGAQREWAGAEVIVTPACGLAGLDEATAEARLVAAGEIARG